MRIRRIGVLTGGGDAPGLNPALKAIVYRATAHDVEVMGLPDGWHGLLDTGIDEAVRLEDYQVRRWDRDGGTNLGSSRTNPFRVSMPGEASAHDRSDEVMTNIVRLGLDAVIALGGEDTLGVAHRLSEKGCPVVGIPKTIDKDLSHTDYTLGFDTALRNCTTVIEQARTPAGSHHWVQVVEVMGRHAGHLALWSAVAGGAALVLIPEHPFAYERVYELLAQRLARGKQDRRYPRYAVIVAAEGAHASEEEVVTLDASRDDSRELVIGHSQRGGSPSALDRIMGRVFGCAAVEAVLRGDWGQMVSAQGIGPTCQLRMVPLSQAVSGLNTVDLERVYDTDRYTAKV